MNIYLITRTDDVDYDQPAAVVVVARSYAEARQVARTAKYSPSPRVWDAANATLKLIGTALDDQPAGIILTDFLRG